MNPNDKPNFLDRNTIIAFALILVVWIGWSKYMDSKYPPAPADTSATQQKAQNAAPNQASNTGGTTAPTNSEPGAAAAVAPADQEERFVTYDNENLSFQISSKGMGLKNVDVKKYKTRDEKPIILGAVSANLPFATYLVGSEKPLDFVIEQTAPEIFVGRATINGMVIEKTMKVQAANYSIETQIKATNIPEGFGGLSTTLSDPLQQSAGGGLFSSNYDHQDWFIRHDNTKNRQLISAEHAVQVSHPNVTLAALSGHYFTLAVVDRSELLPRFESNVVQGAPTVTGRLVYQPVSKPEAFNVNYVAYAGPKNFEILGNVDSNLPLVIDFGIFGFLGKPILWLLKALFGLMGNWGWAIIVLTIIVRLIVLPFNAYSFKAMKAMQKIQPEMTRIKEKYKDGTPEQRLQMNQEIMDLMKREKANPLSSCLPTLLQLPVFFALFQVLGQSIELYRAPFGLWIQDLSVKDPYYVLPILMGITMFIQQKLTPTTMDPQQAKIMLWVPVIFSVFMITLPSGLALYIFVSTLFGIIQQYIFMRDSQPVQSVKAAKA